MVEKLLLYVGHKSMYEGFIGIFIAIWLFHMVFSIENILKKNIITISRRNGPKSLEILL